MTSYSVDLDLVGALATPATCPGCGGDDLVPQAESGAITFTCTACARAWYADAGVLVPLHRFPAMRTEPGVEHSSTQVGA